jgi:hypothetical protein
MLYSLVLVAALAAPAAGDYTRAPQLNGVWAGTTALVPQRSTCWSDVCAQNDGVQLQRMFVKGKFYNNGQLELVRRQNGENFFSVQQRMQKRQDGMDSIMDYNISFLLQDKDHVAALMEQRVRVFGAVDGDIDCVCVFTSDMSRVLTGKQALVGYRNLRRSRGLPE